MWLVGNGGSACLASHMATDLQLAGVRAQALTDVAAVTTYGNDCGYEFCFSRQITHLAKRGDLLIAISGSGNSPNILNAADTAEDMGVQVVTVTGFEGGQLISSADAASLYVPVNHMGVAQDVHQVMLHLICYSLMEMPRD